ncbi:MAG: hypothetical protein P8N76_17380 [Pirellulaceae bacterium]|nr:hypothetical protein [Pirellulaceae bacterium]
MLAYFASERGSLMHPLIVGISSAIPHSLSSMAIAATVHWPHQMIADDHHHENDKLTQAVRSISAGEIVIVRL